MIEKETDLICSKKHSGQPILFVAMNQQSASEKLLCASCIRELRSGFFSISFEEAKFRIQQNQEKIQETLNLQTKRTSEQLQLFTQKVDTLKSNIVRQFDSVLKNSEEWAKNLAEYQKKKTQYSFFEEIEHLDEPIKYQEEKIMFEFNQFNYSYYKKIETMFQIEGLLKDILSSKQAIDDLQYSNIAQIYSMPSQSIKIKKYEEINTPHIVFKCKKHNSEIIYIDLKKNIKKEERMKCVSCKRGDTVTVVKFQELWDKYQNDKQQSVFAKSSEQKKKLEDIKEGLYTFIIDLAKIIRETILFLDNNSYLSLSKNKQIDTSLEVQVISMAEKLSQVDQVSKGEEKEYQKTNEEDLYKLSSLTQYLNRAFEIFQFKRIETINRQSNFTKTQNSLIRTYNKISYQIVNNSIKQEEDCYAMAFNHDGSIMAATCGYDIRIWQFQNCKLEKTQANLQGHTSYVYCLVYSKSRNWIASGSDDNTIRLWKDIGKNQWVSSEVGNVHTSSVQCLLMNGRENQLISGSLDNSIKIWTINYQLNSLNYEYSLDKHLHFVYSISLNESETALVSCSLDKQILIWRKGQNQKWEFKDTIIKSIDDYGNRVCFINDQTIAWQQYSQGYTHIFKLEKGKFIEKPELKIELKQVGNDGECFFPTVFNKEKQLLIQKHNKYVYVIRQYQDGNFKIECDEIDCNSRDSYGGLTNDGCHLVIWNYGMKEFKVYMLIYD